MPPLRTRFAGAALGVVALLSASSCLADARLTAHEEAGADLTAGGSAAVARDAAADAAAPAAGHPDEAVPHAHDHAHDEEQAPLRPTWLGTRPLEGSGPWDTPEELRDRRLAPPPGGLPAPADDAYRATVTEVPVDVLARSTWHEGCPVTLEDLRYLTVTFWGFDDRPHTGELLVHRKAADGLVEVFRRVYEARFPIEEMRVISQADMEARPTGDGNVTSAFTCRSRVSGRSWSEHAYGLAIDVNPFHNPYLKGDYVIPELARAYVQRGDGRPGMIEPRDEVVEAFADMGWEWGGDWTSAKDWMHFSHNGR